MQNYNNNVIFSNTRSVKPALQTKNYNNKTYAIDLTNITPFARDAEHNEPTALKQLLVCHYG